MPWYPRPPKHTCPRRSRLVWGPRLADNLPNTDPQISGHAAFRYSAHEVSHAGASVHRCPSSHTHPRTHTHTHTHPHTPHTHPRTHTHTPTPTHTPTHTHTHRTPHPHTHTPTHNHQHTPHTPTHTHTQQQTRGWNSNRQFETLLKLEKF